MELPPVLRHWWSTFGVATRGVLFLLVTIHVVAAVASLHAAHRVCFVPSLTTFAPHGLSAIANGGPSALNAWAVLDFFAAPLFHAGVAHLLFNCLAWVVTAPMLEGGLGTAPLVVLTTALAVASQALLTAAGTVVSVAEGHSAGGTFGCVLGFSGVLFALMAVECYAERPDATYTMCCGVITVPARAYPWLLLVLVALLAPGTSTAGHACGIVCGIAATYVPCSVWTGGCAARAVGACIPGPIAASSLCRQPAGGPGRTWGSGTGGLFQDHPLAGPAGGGPIFGGDPPPPAAASAFPSLPTVSSVGRLAPGASFQAFGGGGRRLGGATTGPDAV